jgi:hypothetical protein
VVRPVSFRPLKATFYPFTDRDLNTVCVGSLQELLVRIFLNNSTTFDLVHLEPRDVPDFLLGMSLMKEGRPLPTEMADIVREAYMTMAIGSCWF